jgi:dTDP-4-amino-4,6-dideoxygalactose transaminase
VTVRVPHFDHAAHYARDKAAIDEAIQRVLAAGTPIMGPSVWEFERAFAAYCDSDYAVGVMSGTAALQLALATLDLQPGDEVITVANSDIPTSHAITHAGATVVWVDIDPHTYNLDPDAFAHAITPRTRAVLPVHLYGVPAQMDRIGQIAETHGLAVVEDAAIATGAIFHGQKVGSLGTLAAFSTAPGKLLGGICSGGMITTSAPELHAKLQTLRYYGRERSAYPHDGVPWPSGSSEIGYNERLNTIDAAVLLIRLAYLDDDLATRSANAALYRRRFQGTAIRCQAVPAGAVPAWRVFTVRIPNRDRVYAALREQGYEVTLPYLPANHLEKCYAHLGVGRGELPETEAFCDELLALPCHQYLSEEIVEELADKVVGLIQRE